MLTAILFLTVRTGTGHVCKAVVCVCVYHVDSPHRMAFPEISHLRFLQNSVDILQFCLKSYTDKNTLLEVRNKA